ncbi:hypothetical protein PAAG_11539 [Paracoccidioides lutzii Pb01]|uniref:Exo-beta-D-glucosaminidase Ig-fold domain-containing protein n=1 Tax=Paracoccidioides lutzii (strain ATCC MYA-826 / Pb01) TaxID=502779 RepID=A0A0A2V2L1_PARBA|nr:hypothetical protein PAAG_11539 [Paracoccidioides lutzii Pb01]KGQ01693.1 hypothetical protein PAAG_11539 [Paracoccidioides lutzii Pb01]
MSHSIMWKTKRISSTIPWQISDKRSIAIDAVGIRGNSLAKEKHNNPFTTPFIKKNRGQDSCPRCGTGCDALQAGIKRRERDQTLISRNVYWIPRKLDVLEWDNSIWYHTPVTRYSDFTVLNQVNPASVKQSIQFLERGVDVGDRDALITLQNESDIPDIFVRLSALDSEDGKEIAPIFWSDNYVTLFPRETVEFRVECLGIRCGEAAVVQVVDRICCAFLFRSRNRTTQPPDVSSRRTFLNLFVLGISGL